MAWNFYRIVRLPPYIKALTFTGVSVEIDSDGSPFESNKTSKKRTYEKVDLLWILLKIEKQCRHIIDRNIFIKNYVIVRFL